MKKLLLILLLAGLGQQVFAIGVYSTNSWRWRNDDGTESTATFKTAEQNTEITISNADIIRLRVEIVRTDQQQPAVPAIPILKYIAASGGGFVEITTDPATTNAFYLTTSAHDVSGNTTDLLTSSNPHSSVGKVFEQQATNNLEVPSNNGSAELEWVLKPTAYIVPDEIYSFVVGDYMTSAIPTIKIAGPLPVNLVSYTAKTTVNGVKLQWAVASETNNNHFTIAHSADGKHFANLGTEKSKGSGKGEYTFNHYTPENGINYYRLSQTDIDGQTKILGTEVVNFTLSQKTVSITPNPADRNNIIISLSVADKKQYSVKLFDISGRKLLDKNIIPYDSKLLITPGQPLTSGTYIIEIEELGRFKVIVK